jgi:hypothetical protein
LYCTTQRIESIIFYGLFLYSKKKSYLVRDFAILWFFGATRSSGNSNCLGPLGLILHDPGCGDRGARRMLGLPLVRDQQRREISSRRPLGRR